MLPDWPASKREYMKLINLRFRKRHDKVLGFLSTMPRRRAFEGHQMEIVRGDGRSEVDDFIETSESITFDPNETEKLSFDEILERVDQVAVRMAEKVAKNLYQSIHTTLEAKGQTVDVRGIESLFEQFLMMLEKVDIPFDSLGKPQLPTLVASPQLVEKISKSSAEFEDPKNQARLKELYERKRKAWNEREAARRLAD